MSEFARSVVEAKATCLICGREFTALADEADFVRWFSEGELIQVAMPEAPTWTREVFMGWRSGAFICQECTGEMEAVGE